MDRIVVVLASTMLILGLAVVHFSLANARPALSPASDHEEGHDPDPPTSTPLPSASISPSSGSVGTSIRVSGSNFRSNEIISIKFDNQQIAAVGADSSGSFSTSVDAPGLPAGTYPVEIGGRVTLSFTITSSLSVTPSSGPAGTSITVRASGFNPGSDVDIIFDEVILTTASADNQGRILTTIVVPALPVGTYQVGIGCCFTVSFTITSPPPFINACFKSHKTAEEKQGQLRIVTETGKCDKNETAISWTQ